MTQCLRNRGSSTKALILAVGNVRAVVLSNVMTTQNYPTIHLQNQFGGLHLLSFPLLTIMLQCGWVNGNLIVIWLLYRRLISSKLPQLHTLYWSSLDYGEIQYRGQSRFRKWSDIRYFCWPSIVIQYISRLLNHSINITWISCGSYINDNLYDDQWY